MTRHLITSALPYINGVKHLGNLVGSMLPADVYARYLRMQGREVLFLCATDEHGTPAELAALAAGVPVADYCKEQFDIQAELAQRWNLSFDHFGRSSSMQNAELTQHFAKALNANGFIEERSTIQAYSVSDRRFLPDRYIQGTCPHCSYAFARGDQCENCTRVLNPAELIEPRSAVSGRADIEFRESTHLFLLQSKLVDRIREWVESKNEWPTLAKSIALKWLDEGVEDRGITRDLDWGVPVPDEWPDLQGKVFYVWFDAPIEYIACAKEWADEDPENRDWKSWWFDADDVNYAQFMAKDNVPFHTISFPATQLGSGEPWKMVDYLKSFNWLTYYGGKFSTSQQRGIFMHDALDILPADQWRYALLVNAPESSDADFTWESLAVAVNKDLAGAYGNFVNRVLQFAIKNFDSTVPTGGTPTELETEFEGLIRSSIASLSQHFDQMQFRKAMQELRALWSLGNAYLDRAAPWKTIKTDPELAAMQIRTAIEMISVFSRVSLPVMPDTTEAVLKACGESQRTWPQASADLATIEQGSPISAPNILFERIEDIELAKWRDRFGAPEV